MSPRLSFSAAFTVALVAAVVPVVRADLISERIDAMVEEGYKQHKITPNAPTTEEGFVRRIYLDVIGRIPSQEEARAFIDSTEAGKRSKLIDQLLNSEGYVSHWYNWWGDILRLQSGMKGEAGQAYAHWIKDSLRKNKPYDQFVKELITAEGYIWDNGAVGYYLRDSGMPLDNMSNTAQIFLGTRLACAQCHNHPFDAWTQKQYYQMAAFTFNVDTTAIANKGIKKDLDKFYEDLNRPARKRTREREKQAMRRIVDGILDPLKNGVSDDIPMPLKLPMDYKYPDATGGDAVTPHVIPIAKTPKPVNAGREQRANYAEWMTGVDNPRFTKVMANRLWKRVMGMGLIEPVDDFKDDTVSTNEPLMKYLIQQFSNSRYDIKRMLRAMYNTKTYQRQVTVGDVPEDKPYYFPGPVLRRMTAEQIWDSICTLVIPQPDLRVAGAGYKAKLEMMKKEAEMLEKVTSNDILKVAEKYADEDFKLEMKGNLARTNLTKAREANDTKAIQAAQKELNEANYARNNLEVAARNELLKTAGSTRSQFVSAMVKPGMKKDEKAEPATDPQTYGQWDGYGDEFFRASELPSPAPGGHFLREFGQSNREIIENSTSEATVSQALNLMNGALFDKIMMEKTQMMRRFYGASNDEGRMNAIYYSLFARKPTDAEKALVLETIAAKGKDGWKNVIWALLNTREFVFVQ